MVTRPRRDLKSVRGSCSPRKNNINHNNGNVATQNGHTIPQTPGPASPGLPAELETPSVEREPGVVNIGKNTRVNLFQEFGDVGTIIRQHFKISPGSELLLATVEDVIRKHRKHSRAPKSGVTRAWLEFLNYNTVNLNWCNHCKQRHRKRHCVFKECKRNKLWMIKDIALEGTVEEEIVRQLEECNEPAQQCLSSPSYQQPSNILVGPDDKPIADPELHPQEHDENSRLYHLLDNEVDFFELLNTPITFEDVNFIDSVH